MIFNRGPKTTDTGKIEQNMFQVLKLVAPMILPSKVKKVTLLFAPKEEIVWSNGFSWLWNNNTKVVTLVLPPTYHKGLGNVWLMIHELYHAKQIVEKRLEGLGVDVFRWNKSVFYPSFTTTTISKENTVFTNGKQNYHRFLTPWEVQANRQARKTLKTLDKHYNISANVSARTKLNLS